MTKQNRIKAVLLIIVFACAAFWLSSPLPDGLEKVMADSGLTSES